MVASYNGADRRLAYLFENATEVSVEQVLVSGTPIGKITVDGTELTLYCTPGGGSNVTYSEVLQSGTVIGVLTIDGVPHTLYAPSGSSSISWASTLTEGTEIGRLTISGVENILYAPPGDVTDVQVNETSVVDENGVANIDLTNYVEDSQLAYYATERELTSAINALRVSFQDGVDRIYDACVSKGSTPASHSLADVVSAIYQISGDPISYAEANAEVEVIPEFETTVEETV